MGREECVRCVLDLKNDPFIKFNDEGLCNHCQTYDEVLQSGLTYLKKGEDQLVPLVNKIKKSGVSKKYDCIIGVSGGVDSTYVAYLVRELGLRPLAVHLDNGWNSDTATLNIKRGLELQGIDLHTYVIDWEEFRDLQLSYLKASVVDAEIPTDHAIAAILFKVANKFGIKYILNGTNVTTEGAIPACWTHDKNDLINLRSIHSKFGSIKLKTFPTLGYIKRFYFTKIKGITSVSILNYVEYNKAEVKEIISKKMKWEDYGGKHFESLFTKFYQGYLLPYKFNIDKRRSHLSTLICSEQISREHALKELEKPILKEADEKELITFIIKKLNLSPAAFNQMVNAQPVSHLAYKSIQNLYIRYSKPYRIIKYKILKIKA